MHKPLIAGVTLAAFLLGGVANAQTLEMEATETIILETTAAPVPPTPRVKPPIRETNKQLIERMRVMNKIRNASTTPNRPHPPVGTTTDMRPIPGRAIGRILHITGSSTPRGLMIRALAASSSNAVFLRADVGTSTNWMPVPARFMGTTTLRGNFEIELPKPRLEQFVDRIFKLFKSKSETRLNFEFQ